MIRKRAFPLLAFFSTAGLLVSLYSLINHLAPIGGSACNVSLTFNCDIVNRGVYSEIFGFPVAGIGVLGYLAILAVAMLYRKNRDPLFGKVLLFLLAGGFVFSLYLTYLEAFVIGAWCLLCLASLSAIVGAGITGFMIYKDSGGSAPKQP